MKRSASQHTDILLMEEILHQLISRLFQCLQGFSTIPVGDRRISEPSTVSQHIPTQGPSSSPLLQALLSPVSRAPARPYPVLCSLEHQQPAWFSKLLDRLVDKNPTVPIVMTSQPGPPCKVPP